LIKNIPLNESPYEKFKSCGVTNLTNAELLAILLRTGTKEKTCLEIANEILVYKNNSHFSDLEYLTKLTEKDLQNIKGIGKIKAIQIISVLELAKRLNLTYNNENKIVLNRPEEVYDIIKQYYVGETKEKITVIFLNIRNKLIEIKTYKSGSANIVNVEIKKIIQQTLSLDASKIILVHNHPRRKFRTKYC